MSWLFTPDVPTEPGLYAVVLGHYASELPRCLRWHSAGEGWRHGSRAEPVRAFYGPIPECLLPNSPATHPPASRTRASGTRSSR